MQYDYVKKREEKKEHNLIHIADRILNCIHAKIDMTMSISNKRYTDYTFRVVNTHGCPILSIENNDKIKNKVLEKLRDEGFQVETTTFPNKGIEWYILISW